MPRRSLSARHLRRAAWVSLAVAGAVIGPVTDAVGAAASGSPSYNVSAALGVSTPMAVAVDPATHRVYIASGGTSQTITVVDGLTRSVVSTINMPSRPSALALDTAAHRLLVSGYTFVSGSPVLDTETLSAVDTTTGVVTSTNSRAGIGSAYLIALDAAAGRVVGSSGAQMLGTTPLGSAPETANAAWTGMAVAGGSGVTAIAVDQLTERAYTANSNDGTVSVLDLKKQQNLAKVTVGSRPMRLAVDSASHALYVSNQDSSSVSVIDGATDKVTATIALPGLPSAIDVDSGAHLVYVGAQVSGFAGSTPVQQSVVCVIDEATNTLLGTVPISGAGARTIAVDPSTHTVWVGSDQLLALDPLVSRRAGTDRFATATAISLAAYDAQGADAVVLARSDNYPDALVGAPFAAAKNAPLLYSSGSTLPAATKAEISRVLAVGKTVYLLGGVGAIPASIDAQLQGMGYPVVRLSGANRYSTAVAVADAMGSPTTVFLATAQNFADALAAGPAAANVHGAILLTAGGALASETSAYLQAHSGTVYAVGGPAAVADAAAKPLSGADRYATAALVAQTFFPAPTTVGLASGTTFADALPASAYLARVGGPLLLTDPGTLPVPTASYVTSIGAGVASTLVFGGTNAISAAAESGFRSALGR